MVKYRIWGILCIFIFLHTIAAATITEKFEGNLTKFRSQEHEEGENDDNGKEGNDSNNEETKTTLPSGDTIFGKSTNNKVEVFYGIPYAQAPIGNLRLKPPKRYKQSIDGKPFTSPACSCIQIELAQTLINEQRLIPKTVIKQIFNSGLFGRVGSSTKQCEDCLNLNVYRPAGVKKGSKKKLPVIVGLFGQGFQSGSALSVDPSQQFMKTAAKVKMPVIFVSVNYRQGAYGFLSGKELTNEKSTNLGLLDQRMALEWVQDNIESFGGDKDNVILNGQSSGSMCVAYQMLMNRGDNHYNGKPLFHGAIMQSGSFIATDNSTSENAQDIFNRISKAAGCGKNNKLECLRQASPDRFRQAQAAVPGLFGYKSMGLSFVPRHDGSSQLPSYAYDMLDRGEYTDIPTIIGNQEDEGTIFAFSQLNVTDAKGYRKYLKLVFPKLTKVDLENTEELYPIRNRNNVGNSDNNFFGSPFGNTWPPLTNDQRAIAALFGDVFYQWPRRKFLDATEVKKNTKSKQPHWSYLAVTGSKTPYLGTMHGSDLILEYFTPGEYSFPAFTYRRHFLSFAYTKDPNNKKSGEDKSTSGTATKWRSYGESKQQLVLQYNGDLMGKDAYRNRQSEYINKNIKRYLI